MQKLEESKDYDKKAIEELVKNLVKKEMITTNEAEAINQKAILQFTKSNIWQEMRQAKEVQKEKPFYMNIPAKEIYQEEVEEEILVQGMIDLYYINKNDELILVDYKTDFAEREEDLLEKYRTQLSLYQKALEEALGKKVSKVLIYSTFLGKELNLNSK